MKRIIISCFCFYLAFPIQAQKSKLNDTKQSDHSQWQVNLDSMYVEMKGHKRIQFIDEDKSGIRMVQAIIYSNGFVSALIDYKDTKGNLLGSRYAMKAKRIKAENFVTNKIFTDNPKYIKSLYASPKIPSVLAGKLKKLSELDGLAEVLDGIKNLRSMADIFKTKAPDGLDALRNNPAKARKGGYSSGVPWDVFSGNGQAKDSGLISIPGGRRNGSNENSDGTVSYHDSFNGGPDIIYGAETTVSPNGGEEQTIVQIDDDNGGGLRISVTYESRTTNSNGSPDDYSYNTGQTFSSGQRTESSLTVSNGSNVGVQREVIYDKYEKEISRTETKVDVEYDPTGTPHEVNRSSNPSETSGRLSPAQEEQFWQSMPWMAELLYANWAKEFAARTGRGNFSRPGMNEGGGITRTTNPYRFNRNIVINCSEVNGCLPLGRAFTDPRQTRKNFINPPRLPH
jgi:hypothetical protein